MKSFQIWQIAIVLVILHHSPVLAQENSVQSLTLTYFDVSVLSDPLIVVEGFNESGAKQSLELHLGKSISMEIYAESLIRPLNTDIPVPPLPIPPQSFQIRLYAPLGENNVGIRVSNVSHEIKILNTRDNGGLYGNQTYFELLAYGSLPDEAVIIDTEAEFGYYVAHEEVSEVTTSNFADTWTFKSYYEIRYSKSTGLLTHLQINNRYLEDSCCTHAYSLESNIKDPNEQFIITFSGFGWVFPVLLSMKLIARRVYVS